MMQTGLLQHSIIAQNKKDPQPEHLETSWLIDINQLTYTIANQHDQFYSFIGVRALAMVHLAIHDILNTWDPQYHTYAFHQEIENFDPVIAIAESSLHLLKNIYPARIDTIESFFKPYLSKHPWDETTQKSIELGDSVASLYIHLRANDGHEKNGDYTPMTKPGDYQFTPGYDWVWKPDFGVVRPFVLDSVAQFRVTAPPVITSKEYADAYNEVKAYGCKNSTVRSVDETHYAHWWAEFGEHGWNRIGRLTAPGKLTPHQTARMFALINTNLYDLYLASFDSKYHYDSWRPVTAIHAGDLDRNPGTEADTSWVPEMVTPPWPDYPSTHAATGASGATIIAHVFGTSKVSFRMESVTALEVAKVRQYDDLDLAAEHCALSRIMNGFHFRFATDEGLKQGRAIAQNCLDTILKPLEESSH